MAIEGTQTETLERWLIQHGITQLSPRDTVHFMRQAAMALQHGHDRHMLYLQVRPQSFIIHPGNTKAGLPDLQLLDISTLDTVSMKEVVTPSPSAALYIPPEQWDGQPCAASDQYALGMVVYQLLTGRTPFSGPKERVIQQHRLIPPPPPSSINKYLSPAIDAVVLRALEKQAEQRFPSIIQFIQALEQAIAYSDLRATLTISRQEANSGTQRTITLPGKRQVTVVVPAGIQEQQVLRIEGQGEAFYEHGPRGPLFLIVSIKDDEPPRAIAQPPMPRPLHREIAQHDPPSPPTHTSSHSPFATQPMHSVLATSSRPRLPVAPVAPIAPIAPASSAQQHARHTRLIVSAIVVLLILASSILFALYRYSFRSPSTLSSSLPKTQANNGKPVATPAQSSTTISAADATATTTTAQANPNPYGQTPGTLQLLDPLTNNQSGARWEVASNGNSFCKFSNGAYHISTAKNNYSFFCSADAQPYTQLHNFVYEVQMTILKGDAGGMGFRLSAAANFNAYYMRLTQDGYYALILFGPTNRILVSGTSPAIHTGLNKTNTLAVAVLGTRIDFYINRTHIDGITDTTYTQGQIALVASDLTNATEVAFNNVRLWI